MDLNDFIITHEEERIINFYHNDNKSTKHVILLKI